MIDKFELPEKWCIKVTKENSKLVGEYFGKISHNYKDWKYYNNYNRPYLRSHNDNGVTVEEGGNSSFSSAGPEGLDLTNEQFERYVLKKETKIVSENMNYLMNLLDKLMT